MPMIAEAGLRCWLCPYRARSTRWCSAASPATALASRIDDAKPTVIVSADAGMRGGKVVPYKHCSTRPSASTQQAGHNV